MKTSYSGPLLTDCNHSTLRFLMQSARNYGECESNIELADEKLIGSLRLLSDDIWLADLSHSEVDSC